jgi:hypothetical protein
MASTDIVTVERLALCGITGDQATPLIGLSIAAVAGYQMENLRMTLAGHAQRKEGVTKYGLAGRYAELNYDQALKLIEMLMRAKNAGGGPAIMGVLFP